jgi:hypothetical protein
LAPAEISIGAQFYPVGPAGPVMEVDTLALTTGAGTDSILVKSLRAGLETTLLNAEGKDSITVGDGSLTEIRSAMTVWGRPSPTTRTGGQMALKLDDSKNTNPAQFTLTALLPPGLGPMERIEFPGQGLSQQSVAFRVWEVASATIDAGSGGNTVAVQDLASRSPDPALDMTLNTGAGSDRVTVDASQFGTSLLVNGQSGDDLLKTGPIGPFGGVNGSLAFDGGDGFNTLIVQGPKVSPLAIPTVPVVLTMGQVEHQGVVWRYSNVGKLQIQNGWFYVNEFLGPIDLVVTSEPSDIQFESSTSVQINASQKLMSLSILSGPVVVSHGNKVIHTGSVNVSGDGTLDLMDNELDVNYNVFIPFEQIRKWIFGKQIFSSMADASHNLGYAHYPGGIDFAPFGTVLVKYTLYGDANLDRRVDFNDLVVLAQHYNDTSGNRNWDQGDFTYEGSVDFRDLTLLSQNYNKAMEVMAVAEPAPAATTGARAVPRRRPYLRPR